MTEDGFFSDDPIPVEALEERARGEEGRAVVTFQGVIRADKEGGEELAHVIYEADRPRAEDDIRALVREVSERWNGATLLFHHRLGMVSVGETGVFMAVSAGKRQDALSACHHAAERVRTLPGLRKKDVFRDGTSRFSLKPHMTILLSDDAISLPQS